MTLTQSIVDDLTPDIPFTRSEVSHRVEVHLQRDAQRIRREFWTQYLLSDAFAQSVIARANTIEDAWQISVGLIRYDGRETVDIQSDGKLYQAIKKGGYIWGGVIYTAKKPIERLLPNFASLHFESRSFPIFVRQAQFQPHTLRVKDPQKIIGTAACWAKGRPSNPKFANAYGGLTAGHVVGSGLYQLQVDDGRSNYSSENEVHAPGYVDAAFLETGRPHGTMSSLDAQILTSVAVGDPVIFAGAKTNQGSGFVTNISAHARYSGSAIPMILCHDGQAQKGDSGALVNVNGKPTSMHLGEIALNDGGTESRTLMLEQIERVLDVELYL